MSDNLKWIFELVDQMSGPANSIVKSLRKLNKELTKLSGNEGLGDVANKLNKLGDSLSKADLKAISHTNKIAKSHKESKKAADDNTDSLANLFKAYAFGKVALSVAQGAFEAFSGVVGAGVNIAATGAKFAYDAIAFRENSMAALEAMLHSAEAADRVYNKAVKIAAVTPFETRDVISISQSLIASGFEESELERVIKAVGDLGAAKGDSEVAKRLGIIMGHTRGKGVLQAEEMLRLNESGLANKPIYDALNKIMGTNHSGSHIAEMIHKKKIKEDVAIPAILTAIESTYGGTMEKQSSTLAGLMSNLASRPFETINAAVSQGFGLSKARWMFKDIVDTLQKAFDPSSALGQVNVNIVDSLSNSFATLLPSTESVLSVVGKIQTAIQNTVPHIQNMADELKRAYSYDSEGDKTIKLAESFAEATAKAGTLLASFSGGFSQGFTEAMQPMLDVLNELNPGEVASGFQYLGRAIGWVAAILSGIVIDIEILCVALARMVEVVVDVGKEMFEAGVNLIAGLCEGIVSAPGKVAQALKDAVKDPIDLFNASPSGLDIHSPSKLTARAGANLMRGFDAGMHRFDMGHSLNDTMGTPLNAMLALPSANWAATLGGGGGITVGSVSVSAPLSLSGADAETAQAAQDAIARLLPTALAEAFEGMAMELGAA